MCHYSTCTTQIDSDGIFCFSHFGWLRIIFRIQRPNFFLLIVLAKGCKRFVCSRRFGHDFHVSTMWLWFRSVSRIFFCTFEAHMVYPFLCQPLLLSQFLLCSHRCSFICKWSISTNSIIYSWNPNECFYVLFSGVVATLVWMDHLYWRNERCFVLKLDSNVKQSYHHENHETALSTRILIWILTFYHCSFVALWRWPLNFFSTARNGWKRVVLWKLRHCSLSSDVG